MAPKKVLIVLTSCAKMDNGNPTGWYLVRLLFPLPLLHLFSILTQQQPELAHPYYDLIGDDESNPKVELVIASPDGGVAPLDQTSVTMFAEDPESVKFVKEKKSLWEETRPLKEFLGKASEFDAIFYPGGHGTPFSLIYFCTSCN